MLSALLLPLAAYATDALPVQVEGRLCHPRNLFVRGTDAATMAKAAAAGVRVLQRFPEIDYTLVEAPSGYLQASHRRLTSALGAERVDYDRAARPAYIPNDTHYSSMWHPPAVKADLAWDVSLGSSSAIVAILDTGVNVAHEDLTANIWVNPGEIAGNGIDDDGNGYVDDVNGYDFAYGDGSPDDVHGHGTACAGLAAAVGDNSLGVTGIAPRARIMALKVANNSGYFYDSATVPAYLYGAKMGAKVYSMSYYADGVSRAEGSALQYAASAGVLPIAAAGNDRTIYPYYPGAYEFVVGVAALGTDLKKASFSNYGSWVDVAAPGVSLYTTTAGGAYTSSFSGTSGACPVVAGVAALLFGTQPAATATRVRNAIEESATLQSQAPFGEFTNYGLVNADAAMQHLLGNPGPAKPPKVRWISPIGSVNPETNPLVGGRVYGRNLRKAITYVSGVPMEELTERKDWFVYRLPTTSGRVAIKEGGKTIASAYPSTTKGTSYPMAEACTPRFSGVTGGFFETVRQDGISMRVTPEPDGAFLLQATFKRLPDKGSYYLAFERQYNNTSGNEIIEIYNWRGWSYPYSNFVVLRDGPAPSTMTRTVMPIKDIGRFADFEGTVYLRVRSALNQPSDAELLIDTAFLRPAN